LAFIRAKKKVMQLNQARKHETKWNKISSNYRL
jgi:hypothetical protein